MRRSYIRLLDLKSAFLSRKQKESRQRSALRRMLRLENLETRSMMAVNAAPTLNAIANVSILEDNPPYQVNLAGITAGLGESQPLRVTAVSSNPLLIPDPVVDYTSQNPTGSLTMSPVADKFGSSIITVSVEDGGSDGDLNTKIEFAVKQRLPGGHPKEVIATDLNHDNFLDLVSAGYSDSQILVRLNDGTGNFSTTQSFPSLNIGEGGMAMADFNGDGNVDLVLSGERQTGKIGLYLGNSDGSFQPGYEYSFESTGGLPRGIIAKDLTGDSIPDVAVVDGSFHTLSILPFNRSSGAFSTALIIGTAPNPVNLESVDVDVDGDYDLLVTAANNGAQENVRFQVYKNNGAGSFSPFDEVGGLNWANRLATGDVNQDGHVDAVVFSVRADHAVNILINDGEGNFHIDSVLPMSSSTQMNDVDLLDFDNDGWLDLVVAEGELNTIHVFRNVGGVFEYGSSFSGGLYSSCLTHADLDSDGDQDILVGNNRTDAYGTGSDDIVVVENKLEEANKTIRRQFRVQVSAVNDPPQITNFGGDIAFIEKTQPKFITTSAVVSDIDSPNFDSGKLIVKFSANGKAEDRLAIKNNGSITTDASKQVLFNGIVIGTYVGGIGLSPLVVSFKSAATAMRVTSLLRSITYSNISNDPSSDTRTVWCQLTDGDGGTSVPVTKLINVVSKIYPPVIGGFGGVVANTLSVNPNFGTNGKATFEGFASRSLMLRDGRIAVSSSGSNSEGSWKTTIDFFLANGQPDLTMGNQGRVQIDLPSGDYARGLFEQSDGKLLICGTANWGGGSDNDWFVARLNANGTIDTTFGTNGSTIIDVPSFGQADSVAQLATGQVIVVGRVDRSSKLGIARLSSIGVIDATFGSQGQKVIDLGNANDNSIGYAKVLPAVNGSFWVKTGREYQATLPKQSMLFKIESDASISVDVRLDLGTEVRSDDTVVDSLGRMVVVGTADSDLFLVRYTTSGALDSSFGNGGIVRNTVNPASGAGSGLALLPDGNLLTAYISSDPTKVILNKFQTNGAMDSTFGTNGIFTVDFQEQVGGDHQWLDLTAMKNNAFWLGSPNTNWQYRGMQLVMPPGTALSYIENAAPTPIAPAATLTDVDSPDLDSGKLTVKFSVNGKAEDRLTIRNAGNIATNANSEVLYIGVVIGTFTGGVGTTPLVVSFNSASTPAKAQAILRNVVYSNNSDNPSTLPRTVWAQITDGDGGTSSAVTKQIVVIPINDAPVLGGISGTVAPNTLNISPNFGVNGKVMFDGFATRSLLLRDGRIAVSSSGSNSEGSWKTTIDFFLANGQPDLTMGNQGRVQIDLPSGDYARGMFEQSDGKLLISGTANWGGGSDNDWFVARLNANGTVDTSFGTNGATIIDVPSFGQADSVAQLATGQVIVVGRVDRSSKLGIARLSSIGVIDATFGSQGQKVIDLGNTNDNSIGYAKVLPAVNGSFWVKTGREYQATLPKQSMLFKIESDASISVDVRLDLGTEVRSDDIVVDALGRMVVVGTADTDLFLVRYTSSGALDSTFGNGGIVRTTVNSASGAGSGLALLPDGNLLTAYISSDPTKVILNKFKTNGAMDGTFGTSGNFTVDFQEQVGGDIQWLDLTAMKNNAFWLGSPNTNWQYRGMQLVMPPGTALSYTENAAPTPIAPAATLTDVDSPNFDGGKLTVKFSVNGKAEDRLTIKNAGSITTNASNEVLYAGVAMGTYTGGVGTTPLVVLFNSTATPAKAQALLRSIAYSNISDNPSVLPRTVWAQITDGDGGTSATATKQIVVIPVNDAPVLGGISGSINYVRNTAGVQLSSIATVSDVDSTNFDNGVLRIRITDGIDAGNRLEISGTIFTIDANNNLIRSGIIIGKLNTGGGIGSTSFVVTFNNQSTAAIVQQLMRAIRFRTVSSNSLVQRVVSFSLTDGDGGTSNTVTKTILVS